MWRRPVVAGALLLAIFAGLSLLNSPRGFLGTDTGGKVATLEAMTAGPGISLDPDLGYWAEEWDPDGSVQPIYYTAHLGRRWVNVTTLPMLYAALPLYDVGGYRAALLLPMLGSVAAAFAARALARRLGGDDRISWLTYWVVGGASPMTVYALDFWEHSWGVALMGWAVVLVWDVVDSGGQRWLRSAAAGALFGLSFTLRTETLVYVGVTGLVAGATLLARSRSAARSFRWLVASGLAAVVCFGVVAFANELVERVVLDQGLRSARATGVASLAGDAPADRLTEAAYTLAGAAGTDRGVLIGVVAVGLFAYGVLRSRTDARFGLVVVAGAGLVFLLRYADGLGFVPGLFVAWPLATVGVLAIAGALGAVRAWPAAVAAVAIPLVVATQFRGGAAPQWAGRYVLVSGLLLTIGGAVATVRLPRAAQRASVAACLVVTTLGVAWLSVRTHDVDRAVATINARPEPVVVSSIAHLAREGGATFLDKRWLTAIDRDLREEAAGVVSAAGETRFVLVELRSSPAARAPVGWRRVGPPTAVELFDGVDLRLTSWARSGSR